MGMLLTEAAAVIRSKNAGPFELTLDILFKDEDIYSEVKGSGQFTSEFFEELYGVKKGTVLKVIFFDPAYAVKITMKRVCGSGDIGDNDIYGAQQHAPLLTITLEVD